MNPTLLIALALTGCKGPEDDSAVQTCCDPDDSGDTSWGDSSETGDSGEVVYALSGGCEAPSELGGDPLTMTATYNSLKDPAVFMEVVESVVDWDAMTVDVTGQGGFMHYDLSGKAPTLIGQHKGSENRFYRLARFSDDYVVASHRDYGLVVFDASDPTAPVSVGVVAMDDASALAWRDGRLYVLTYAGALHTYDTADPTALQLLHTLEGLGSPWELSLDGDHAWVADNTLGLIGINLSDPDAPALGAILSDVAGAQDVAVEDGHVYVAMGSAGIASVSIADPSAPALLDTIHYGAAAVALDVSDGRVWGVTHESVVVVDASDPSALSPLATERTDQWAMDVDADGERALVGDWGSLDLMAFDPSILAPDADISRSEVYLYAGSSTDTLELTNRGGAALNITGGQIDDERFSATIDRLSVAPGETAVIEVTFADDGSDVEATLCLSTDDPDDPLVEVALATSSDEARLAIGEAATDFLLQDLDGNYHQLSEQLGSPVVLAFFATW